MGPALHETSSAPSLSREGSSAQLQHPAAAAQSQLLLEKWFKLHSGTLWPLIPCAGYNRPAARPLLMGSGLTFFPKTKEITSLGLQAEICVKHTSWVCCDQVRSELKIAREISHGRLSALVDHITLLQTKPRCKQFSVLSIKHTDSAIKTFSCVKINIYGTLRLQAHFLEK